MDLFQKVENIHNDMLGLIQKGDLSPIDLRFLERSFQNLAEIMGKQLR